MLLQTSSSRLFQDLIVYATFPWRQLHLMWLKRGVVFMLSSVKLHGYASLESFIRLHKSWDFCLYKRGRILWGSLKWITRENYLRQRIPVPRDIFLNLFKVRARAAKVIFVCCFRDPRGLLSREPDMFRLLTAIIVISARSRYSSAAVVDIFFLFFYQGFPLVFRIEFHLQKDCSIEVKISLWD